MTSLLIKGVHYKTSSVHIILFSLYIGPIEMDLQIIVPTPYNIPLIMEGREKNVEDPMQSC